MIELMIAIDKNEAMTIRKKYPQVKITRTCKSKSKRHRYYVEESRKVMRIITALRGGVE